MSLEDGIRRQATRYLTISGIGIDLLNDTTKSVNIEEAQTLMKEKLVHLKDRNLGKDLTDEETVTAQWRHWRILASHRSTLYVERYHPPGKRKTYIRSQFARNGPGDKINVRNLTGRNLSYFAVSSSISESELLSTNDDTLYLLKELEGKFHLEDPRSSPYRRHSNSRAGSSKRPMESSKRVSNHLNSPNPPVSSQYDFPEPHKKGTTVEYTHNRLGRNISVTNISGKDVKHFRNLNIWKIINYTMEAEIFTEESHRTIKFFIDEPSPRLIAIDSSGVLRGRWTMDSVQKGSSEPASHSKHGHKGREENRQMRQHNRGTTGTNSESESSVVKKPPPLASNVISKCFTHNPELESVSLVYSGRPTDGLHLMGKAIRYYGYKVMNSTNTDVWWDEIADGLSKRLQFPAKENEQQCEIRSDSSESLSKTGMLMVDNKIHISRHRSAVKEHSIMTWMDLGQSSNGCPYNKKHVRGQVKVYHHEVTPQYTLSIRNKLENKWSTNLWELVNNQLLHIKNLPHSNDGQVWNLQHYGHINNASVELISSDKRQRFHFTLGTDDGRNRSQRNSHHSSSHHHGHENHGNSNHHGSDDDPLKHLKSTHVFAPIPVRRKPILSHHGDIGPSWNDLNSPVSAEHTARPGHTSTPLPNNTQNFPSPSPPSKPPRRTSGEEFVQRRSEGQEHNRREDYTRGGYTSSSDRGYKKRKKIEGKVARKAINILKGLRRKNRRRSSETGDGNEEWRNITYA